MSAYAQLAPGDHGPWFKQRSPSNERYTFNTAGGRWVLLAFMGSAASDVGAAMWRQVQAMRAQFDDDRVAVFAVTMDPQDEAQSRIQQSMPGVRIFWDFDGKVGKLYGAIPKDWEADGGTSVELRPQWVLLEPTMRVARIWPATPQAHTALAAELENLPPVDLAQGEEIMAPVLFLPRVFEPELCRALIKAYDDAGGEISGFMVEKDGKTHLAYDDGHKTRRDHLLTDEGLIAATRVRIKRRITNEIKKVHMFDVTRMERFLVGCYTAEDRGHFRPHRDNTTPGTAHRKFAVSINLNNEFEGGRIGFPEYGSRTFKPPPGGAVVFSCALLHVVSPVTAGRRYAFLPFLYDEAAAKLREEMNSTLVGTAAYSANGETAAASA